MNNIERKFITWSVKTDDTVLMSARWGWYEFRIGWPVDNPDRLGVHYPLTIKHKGGVVSGMKFDSVSLAVDWIKRFVSGAVDSSSEDWRRD